MTIKGKTQDVSAPFTFKAAGSRASFDGAFVLKRADYNIGEGMWADFGTVANEIQVKFHFEAAAATPVAKK
jgi:polyisoprenoid-binding protein YceI